MKLEITIKDDDGNQVSKYSVDNLPDTKVQTITSDILVYIVETGNNYESET